MLIFLSWKNLIWYLKLHISHLENSGLIKEILIQFFKQVWWTYLIEPSHKQGAIKGEFLSPFSRQILQIFFFKFNNAHIFDSLNNFNCDEVFFGNSFLG